MGSMGSFRPGFLTDDCASVGGSGGYGIPGNFHTGADYSGSANDPVYSIGSGTVIYSGSFGAGNGSVIMIQYTAPDSSVFVVVYGHLNSTGLHANGAVSAGDQVGSLWPNTPNGVHRHLGIHPGAGVPSGQWGNLPCPVSWPPAVPSGTNGFVDPMPYLNAHGSVSAATMTAFQANNGDLYTYDAANGAVHYSLGMASGTSPSIASLTGGGYEVAFQANNGHLYVYTTGGSATDTSQGMASGTSPSVTGYPGGGYEIAFQANNGDLYTYDTTYGASHITLGMASGTSPSIASSSGGYEIAFQANNGDLYTYSSSSGTTSTTLGLATVTSPSITYVSNTYEVSFQANTGNLFNIPRNHWRLRHLARHGVRDKSVRLLDNYLLLEGLIALDFIR